MGSPHASSCVNYLLVMVAHISLLWLAMVVLVLSTCSASAMSTTRVQQHLTRLNKPAISTIESPDGDMIDCVLISQQPAFDHPLLKDHKIQMQPEYYANTAETAEVDSAMDDESRATGILGRRFSSSKPQVQTHAQKKVSAKPRGHQLWHHVGVSCPEGTIPIRRTTEQDLHRSESQMHNYGRKFHHPAKPSSVSAASVDATGHQHAIGYVQGGKYYGAKANINVWNPSVQVSNEFSLSQIWILGGSFNNDLNSIEAGWQVSPDLYGDNNTRLFIYWTDPKQGNWWMQFGNKYILGYWPAALFTTLSTAASMVEWGGEVVNSEPGGHHTATQMGSGHFPFEGFDKSSYFSHILIVDANNNLISPGDVSPFAEHPTCYNVQPSSSSDWGTYFYYGGPGRNPDCP